MTNSRQGRSKACKEMELMECRKWKRRRTDRERERERNFVDSKPTGRDCLLFQGMHWSWNNFNNIVFEFHHLQSNSLESVVNVVVLSLHVEKPPCLKRNNSHLTIYILWQPVEYIQCIHFHTKLPASIVRYSLSIQPMHQH